MDKAILQCDTLEKELLKVMKHNYQQALKKAKSELAKYEKLIKEMDLVNDKLPDWELDENVKNLRELYFYKQKHFKSIINSISQHLVRANIKNGELIQETLADYYQINRQFTIDGLQMHTTTSFAMIPKEQVKIMLTDTQPPFSKIAFKKFGSNKKIKAMLTNEFMQAVILGESIDKLAKRLQKVAGYTNAYQAQRLAQTERTRIQNQARYDTGKEAVAKGLKLTKEWSARLRNTRETHAFLHGQVIPFEEKFLLPDGDRLEYPGDPNGRPENTINCFCILITDVVENPKNMSGFKM
ncbi:MAG: phage minor head protein [Eubacteriales bacterium]|nr:phage minor head protein [Eubacteriales bacterium]